MVDISQKVKQIVEEYIEPGYYFAINRGRQYGKNTTLYQLEKYLQDQYMIISISFEGADDLFDSRENAEKYITMHEERLAKLGYGNFVSKIFDINYGLTKVNKGPLTPAEDLDD